MMDLGLAWHVYELTKDPLYLGLVGLVQFVPFVLLVIPAGYVADRVDRIWLLRLSYAGCAVCASLVLWFALLGLENIYFLLLAMAIFGVARAFFLPTSKAIIRSIVPRFIFANAIALNGTVNQMAVIGGPVLGCLVYLAGPAPLFSLVVVLLIITILLLGYLRPLLTPEVANTAGSRGVLEGLDFVVGRRILLGAISLDLFAVLFGGVTAVLPVYAKDILHLGPMGLGAMRPAPAVGAAITSTVLASWPIHRWPGIWMFGGIGANGLATILFGLSTSLLLSVMALLAIGSGDRLSVFVRQTLVQVQTSEHIRGRVSAVASMFIGASNELGAFEPGVAVRLFGPMIGVKGGGPATIVVVAAYLRLFPSFLSLGGFEEEISHA